MAKLRVVKKEVTIIAENRGHGLFLWKKSPNGSRFETACARCGEEFAVAGIKKCNVAGAVNYPCPRKGAA